MPKNAQKSINPWTEQHEAFCFENKIPPAAQHLWQWLLRQGNEVEEIEPDLSEFNEWVEKFRGKKYSHNYLKEMFELLKKLGVISTIKKFCWKIYRLVIRPLEWLKPRKRQKSQLPTFTYNLQPSNDSNAVGDSMQQQHSDLERNQETLALEGIEYDTSDTEVLSRPNWEIRAAIVLFNIRSSTNIIENPEGWLRQCLRKRYWETRRNYVAIISKCGYPAYYDSSELSIEDALNELYSLQQKTP